MRVTIGVEKTLNNEKFYQVTADLKRYRINQLNKMQDNTQMVVEYLNLRMREGNLKPATRANTIDRLFRLSIFHKNKSFREMTTEDIFSYLDSLRRTESQDPLHKWIGTYNLSLVKIMSFFKWMYDPDSNSKNRRTPSFLTKISFLKRKEKTSCSATDLWTEEEDSIFLKYCPDKRLRLYHILARETSGRPHELLALRIGQISFLKTEDGKSYAIATIGKGGKTNPRTVPIINSIGYLKDWLATGHPHGNSRNHYLFPSIHTLLPLNHQRL